MPKPLFPRNIAARSDYSVTGNAAHTRPQSSVDNCYPGLDCDSRNLESKFFEGLVFEYHREFGATVASLELTKDQIQSRLTEHTLPSPPAKPWLLFAIYGRIRPDADPVFIGCKGLSGSDVWRFVRLLLPERVAIAFGPAEGIDLVSVPDLLKQMQAAYRARMRKHRYIVMPDPNRTGNFQYAVFSQRRAQYLDEDGVISPAFEPGFLTKTLCAPWVYDFRDCGCQYWAAAKPDVVTSADGQIPYLNFMRRRNEAPQADTAAAHRPDKEYKHVAFLQGEWKNEPFVLNGRESTDPLPTPEPITNPLSFDQLVKMLNYLATVEHGLMAEYLYAYYSIDQRKEALSKAAKLILQVAVDEMQHLFWVNKLLKLLNQPPSLRRAAQIDAASAKASLPVELLHVSRAIQFRPLSGQVLQEFIEIEQVSRDLSLSNKDISGMYVFLLESLKSMKFPTHATGEDVRQRVAEIIKLLIDEGEGHYTSLRAAEKHLEGIPEAQWTRSMRRPKNQKMKQLQNEFKQTYERVLGALRDSLSAPQIDGKALQTAIGVMHELHSVASKLAQFGIDIPFAEMKAV
jgi:hypothetical protein